MQGRWNVGFVCVSGLVATLTLVSVAFSGETPRSGVGDGIEFTTATAPPPVQRPELPDRRGFGYVIHFTASDPAESLFPPGSPKRRGTATAAGN